MITRDQQLVYCRVCKNQKFDLQQGIICGLTGRHADFEGTCPSFVGEAPQPQPEELLFDDEVVDYKLASQGKRFANYLLDTVFVIITSVVMGGVLGIFLGLFAPDLLPYFEEDHKWLNYLLGFLSGMIYYTLFEFLAGRTVAKFITNTKVVTLKGKKPEFETILIRSLCRYIPFEQFSFLGSDGTGLHDSISKTKVVELPSNR